MEAKRPEVKTWKDHLSKENLKQQIAIPVWGNKETKTNLKGWVPGNPAETKGDEPKQQSYTTPPVIVEQSCIGLLGKLYPGAPNAEREYEFKIGPETGRAGPDWIEAQEEAEAFFAAMERARIAWGGLLWSVSKIHRPKCIAAASALREYVLKEKMTGVDAEDENAVAKAEKKTDKAIEETAFKEFLKGMQTWIFNGNATMAGDDPPGSRLRVKRKVFVRTGDMPPKRELDFDKATPVTLGKFDKERLVGKDSYKDAVRTMYEIISQVERGNSEQYYRLNRIQFTGDKDSFAAAPKHRLPDGECVPMYDDPRIEFAQKNSVIVTPFSPWLHEKEKNYGIKLDMGFGKIAVLERGVWKRQTEETVFDEAKAKKVEWGASQGAQDDDDDDDTPPKDLPRSSSSAPEDAPKKSSKHKRKNDDEGRKKNAKKGKRDADQGLKKYLKIRDENV